MKTYHRILPAPPVAPQLVGQVGEELGRFEGRLLLRLATLDGSLLMVVVEAAHTREVCPIRGELSHLERARFSRMQRAEYALARQLDALPLPQPQAPSATDQALLAALLTEVPHGR